MFSRAKNYEEEEDEVGKEENAVGEEEVGKKKRTCAKNMKRKEIEE